ncbi:hypothetical protein N9920_03910, partial [Akkermansiaceae bacterium]|nr:hypothetical protein [Akkermansiaceae bacterium]
VELDNVLAPFQLATHSLTNSEGRYFLKFGSLTALKSRTASEAERITLDIREEVSAIEENTQQELLGILADDTKLSSLTEAQIVTHRSEVAKIEIRQGIERGIIEPSQVTGFSDLHDFVDANMYLNDADRADRFIGPFGKSKGWGSQEFAEISNKIADVIDSWIKDGMPSFSLGNSAMADSIIGDVTARVRDPEARADILENVILNVDQLKRDADKLITARNLLLARGR